MIFSAIFSFLAFAKGAGNVCYFSGCVSMYSYNLWSVSFGLLAFVCGVTCLKLVVFNYLKRSEIPEPEPLKIQQISDIDNF